MNTSSSSWIHACSFPEGRASYIDAIVFLAISAVAVFGNILVFVSYFRFVALQGVTNVFILSLSASDLFVAFVSVPYSFTILVCDIKNPVDAENKEALYNVCDMVPSIWSIYSLALVALDRVFAIWKPFFHQRSITRRTAWISVVAVWLLALVFVLLKFAFHPRGFTLFIITVAYFVPVSVMIVSYLVIGYVARVQAKALNNLDRTRDRLHLEVTPQGSPISPQRSSGLCSTAPDKNGGRGSKLTLDLPTVRNSLTGSMQAIEGLVNRFVRRSNKTDRPRSLRRELKSAITLALILGSFIISWTPFIALNIRYFVCHDCDMDLNVVKYFKILHYANSALNPILYVLLSRAWRAAFAGILCCDQHRSRIQMNSPSSGW